MTKKRVLVIVTEGETDEEFYKEVIATIKKVNGNLKFNFDKIKYICADGIGKLHKKMLSKFETEICSNFKDYEKVVCFCYDSDVFEFNTNPPINRTKMKKEFEAAGADKIIEIVAESCIENFFLYDIEGVKQYLDLPKNYKTPNKKGLELIEQMFKDKNRVYYKGSGVKDLVKALNMNVIFQNICPKLSELCKELGCMCDKQKCKK